jgi:acetyl esterase/lipase
VSTEQQKALDAVLRQSAFPVDIDVSEQRRLLRELTSAQPLPAGVTALGLISPILADLSGLPPLIIQAGTHEVLLDDAVRLAQQAATADVKVTLDITPRVPHVFQAYYPILDEAAAVLDRAGQLLSAHLASAERVTAWRKAERKG